MKSLKYENWFAFVNNQNNGKFPNSPRTFAENLELANFILILYNLNFISEDVYTKKYQRFIDKYSTYLEEFHSLNKF